MQYPVEDIISELKTRLSQEQIVILQAPPGAGKSTIVPLKILNETWLNGKKIVMLQPRRLAARSVAARMAELLSEKAGETVGYRVRFENVIGSKTRIEVVTEGILTRMIQADNALEKVGLIIFDEFHERSLHADLALALSLQIQQLLRNDLKVLIMSATLESEKLSSFLKAPVVTSSGRQFPVEIIYESIDKNEVITNSATRIVKRALKEQRGDILVFLPGAGEIRRVQENLEKENSAAQIFPLYGDLPFQKQKEAILPDPSGKRKIILATSIAETSITIEGITTVIDSGLSRVQKFDPRSGLSKLETVSVTRDAADQRAGRAGRVAPGVCYRLWAKASHQFLQAARHPEILDADLAPVMLELLNWGTPVDELKWITQPPTGAVNQAVELLEQLGAIEVGKITAKGKQMLKLPSHPRLTHMLLSVDDEKQKSLATDIAAMLEERDPLGREQSADLSLRIEILRKWRRGEIVSADRNILERVERLASNWRKILRIETDNSVFIDSLVGKILSEAYPERIALQIEKFGLRFKLVNGRIAKLQDHDGLNKCKWLAAASIDFGSNEGKIFSAAPIDESDLIPLAKEKEKVEWDEERGIIQSQIVKQIGALTLSSKPLAKIDESLRIKTLCNVLRNEGLKLLNWDEAQQQWQARVLSLRKWRPQESWPDVADEWLLSNAEEWIGSYLAKISNRIQFQKLDIDSILSDLLSWEMHQRFLKLAPVKLLVPSGSMIKLEYAFDGAAPIMKVRLQEVFGWAETPTVNEGRTKIILHLLSPGYKPVQITQDLKNFWNTTYAEIRKEFRSQYPKHSWPEDPWMAQAIRGVKRK